MIGLFCGFQGDFSQIPTIVPTLDWKWWETTSEPASAKVVAAFWK